MTHEDDDITNQNGAGGGATATPERTQKSLRMPRVSIEDVRDLVIALDGLSGPGSRNLVFDEAEKAATGGAADKRWGAMGYYGFRRKVSGGKHKITDRGRALLSDDSATVLAAKQQAVMDTGFRPIIVRFSGRPVNQGTVAGVLREDYGVPAESAEAFAALLISVATDAELVVDSKFKPAPIEAAAEAVAGRDAAPKTPRSALPPDAAPKPRRVSATPPDGSKVATEHAQRSSDRDEAAGGDPNTGPFGVSVEIKIDAKDHSPEQIGQIVREVREAITATSG